MKKEGNVTLLHIFKFFQQLNLDIKIVEMSNNSKV
jgi:hypothetical protein